MHWFWVCGIAAGILHIKCSTRQPTYNIIHIHPFNRLEMVFDSMRYSRYSGLNEIRCIFLQCYSWEPFREKYTSQCVNLNQPMWYHRQNGMAWRRWLAGWLYVSIGNRIRHWELFYDYCCCNTSTYVRPIECRYCNWNHIWIPYIQCAPHAYTSVSRCE